MNKEELLEGVTQAAREGIVTREEVEQAYTAGAQQTLSVSHEQPHFGIAEILSYLGGVIVVLGVGIFIGQNWETLNMLTRILSTLGVGVIAYVLGAVLLLRSQGGHWEAFHLIAACLLPLGVFVTLDEYGIEVAEGISSIVFAVLAIGYVFSYRVFRKNLFTLFSIVFSTIFFFTFTSFLIADTAIFDGGDFESYQFLVTGLAYLLLGYFFVNRPESPLTKYLYTFGLLAFFGATLALGGYAPEQKWFWEIIFPGLALGAALMSGYMRSRAFLIIGSGALVVYIFKITAEYFSESLGWPLALVVAGLAFMGVGTLFVRLNKQYR